MHCPSYRINPFVSLLSSLLLALLLVAACGGRPPRAPQGVYDTPEHHFQAGVKFLDKEEYRRAEQEFASALALNGDYGPAMAGKGALMAVDGVEDQARDLIDRGWDYADGTKQELAVIVMQIRCLTYLGRFGRLNSEELADEALDAYEDGLDLVEDEPGLEDPALHYYMGEAYFQALRLDSAEDMFTRVLSLGRGMETEADEALKKAQKVRRAAPRTTAGMRIALVDELSRADMAALLVEELDIERFLGRTSKDKPADFTPPSAPELASYNPPPSQSIVDILNHPLRSDMEVVINYGLRGLRPYPDNLFKPNEKLNRAEAAMIFEDVIVRAQKDSGLATRFIGQESPFTDIRGDHAAFNAVMVCTSKGLLSPDMHGAFGAKENISGVDAVLAVHRLREALGAF